MRILKNPLSTLFISDCSVNTFKESPKDLNENLTYFSVFPGAKNVRY